MRKLEPKRVAQKPTTGLDRDKLYIVANQQRGLNLAICNDSDNKLCMAIREVCLTGPSKVVKQSQGNIYTITNYNSFKVAEQQTYTLSTVYEDGYVPAGEETLSTIELQVYTDGDLGDHAVLFNAPQNAGPHYLCINGEYTKIDVVDDYILPPEITTPLPYMSSVATMFSIGYSGLSSATGNVSLTKISESTPVLEVQVSSSPDFTNAEKIFFSENELLAVLSDLTLGVKYIRARYIYVSSNGELASDQSDWSKWSCVNVAYETVIPSTQVATIVAPDVAFEAWRYAQFYGDSYMAPDGSHFFMTDVEYYSETDNQNGGACVYVYKRTGLNWEHTQIIKYPVTNAVIVINSICSNEDGSRLFISYYGNSVPMNIRIYDLVNDQYVLSDETIELESGMVADQEGGWNIAYSYLTKRLFLGRWITQNPTPVEKIHYYDYVLGQGFVYSGFIDTPSSTGGHFGDIFSVTADGSRIIAVDPDMNSYSGVVHAFKLNSSGIYELLASLSYTGPAYSTVAWYGKTVDISGDGLHFAVGIGNISNYSGGVEFFDWTNDVPVSMNLYSNYGDFNYTGESISFNYEGTMALVGATRATDPSNRFVYESGYARVYQLIDGNYVEVNGLFSYPLVDYGLVGESVFLPKVPSVEMDYPLMAIVVGDHTDARNGNAWPSAFVFI